MNTAITTSGADPPALTKDRLRTVLAEVCNQARLDPSGARLIKFTNNAVFRLARAPVVVRIAGSQTMRDRVSKVIAVARWLAEHDMPAVRLWPGTPQPMQASGHLATLWQHVPASGPPATGADLGRILRRYHSLQRPNASLPTWRPLGPIRQRLAEAEVLSQQDAAYLQDRCDELEETLSRVTYVLPHGPIHGDSFLGNLIPGPTGPVICDFDSSAHGPREWDLTPVAAGELRFAYPGNHHQLLAESYGFDITDWDGFPALRELRELQLVTSVLPVLRSNPALVPQWRHRFSTFRNRDTSATWTPYR